MGSAAFKPAVALHVSSREASQPSDKGATVGRCGFFVADGNLAGVQTAANHATRVVKVPRYATHRTVGYHIGDSAVVSAVQYGVLGHVANHTAEAVVVACRFGQRTGEGAAYHAAHMMHVGFCNSNVQG